MRNSITQKVIFNEETGQGLSHFWRASGSQGLLAIHRVSPLIRPVHVFPCRDCQKVMHRSQKATGLHIPSPLNRVLDGDERRMAEHGQLLTVKAPNRSAGSV